jgi:hypothetical protein
MEALRKRQCEARDFNRWRAVSASLLALTPGGATALAFPLKTASAFRQPVSTSRMRWSSEG